MAEVLDQPPPGVVGQDWPTAPPGARWLVIDNPPSGRPPGQWIVPDIPPEPWPNETPGEPWPRAKYGPEGTTWGPFSGSKLADRLAGDAATLPRKLLYWLRKIGARGLDGSGSWVVPYGEVVPATAVYEEELPMAMTWVRTAISASLGPDESLVHVLNWRHSTVENQGMTAAELKTFATLVRDRWAAFMGGSIQGGTAVSQSFNTLLRYTEVRASLLTQAAGGEDPVWVGATQVTPFLGPVGGTNAASPLPFEVAMCVSMNTPVRGTSRFRGRLYLGCISTTALGGQGQFVEADVNRIGQVMGEQLLDGVAAGSDWEAHVISQKHNTSAKITGIRMGEVPDSQRRRRRSRPENYTQVWGTPVGA